MNLPSQPSQVTIPVLSDAQRGELLEALVEVALNAALPQIDPLTTQLADALQHSAAHAGKLLRQNRYPFFYLVSERLRHTLEQEICILHGADDGTGDELVDTIGTVSVLEPELEVDKKIHLLKLARLLEDEQAECLTALCARLAFLAGQARIDAAQNPFRAHVFLNELHASWCEFQPDAAAHGLVYPLLEPGRCIEIGTIFHALNSALIKRGVLAGLEEAAQARQIRPAADTVDTMVGADPIQAQLRKLFPDCGRALEPAVDRDAHDIRRRAAAPALPVLFDGAFLHEQGAHHRLVEYLEHKRQKIGQHAVAPPAAAGSPHGVGRPAPIEPEQLAQIRREAPADAWTAADGHALALVCKIFSVLFGEHDIAADMKILLGGLQLPVLQAALADKAFFFDHRHPARRALALLTHLASGWDRSSGAADPRYQTILRNVQRIQSERHLAGFSHAVADLEAFLAQEERATIAALTTPIAQVLQRERRRQALKAAKHEVALRIGTGEVVAFVETFLVDKWVTVLTLAYEVQDEKPQIIASAIQTMDDLTWSVKPKITRQARDELVAKLPDILARLNRWLDAIHWNDAQRVQFFDELARCHASIVRAPLELSPERQLQIALQASQEASQKALRKTDADEPEREPDRYDEQVRQLACGTWLTFHSQNGLDMKVRLAWMSPTRGFFLFATHAHQEAFSLSDEELACALRERRAHILLATGVMDRALHEALIPA